MRALNRVWLRRPRVVGARRWGGSGIRVLGLLERRSSDRGVTSSGLEGLGVKVHGAPERPVGGASVQGAYDSDLGRESTEVSHSGAGP